METLSSREVKDHMSEVLNKVAFGHQRFKIARHNKDVAIIISIEEWDRIEAVMQRIEDEEDIREAELALKEYEETGESIPFDEMKKRVGL